MRAAFLHRHRRSARGARGPVGRVYLARFGDYEYALATFQGAGVSRRSQPERFGRRRGGAAWLDLGPTGGTVCDRDIPFFVPLKAWKLKQTVGTERAFGGCYQARPTVNR